MFNDKMQKLFIKNLNKILNSSFLGSIENKEFKKKLVENCVGDHRPVGRDRIRSRPKNSKIGRDPKKKSGHDRPRVATQNKNPVATDHGSRPRKNIRSRPTTGRGPKKNSGRDPWSVATGILDRSDPRYNF
jgi:hypothetical protein